MCEIGGKNTELHTNMRIRDRAINANTEDADGVR